jgi:8-oxo-dGTP diphosphatase
MQIVVAGALICDSALLVAQRRRPPELAGLWELPGGKVAAGETEPEALVREFREELGVEVVVGERIGEDVPVGEAIVLRAYSVSQRAGTLHPHDHGALRWVEAAGLPDLPWVPADRAWLPALLALLAGETFS